MKKYTNTEPAFSEEIPILETSDSNHADNFNKAFKPLLENTLVNHSFLMDLIQTPQKIVLNDITDISGSLPLQNQDAGYF